MTINTPRQQQIFTNRKFNCMKRNQHYEKSYMIFYQLHIEIKKLKTTPEADLYLNKDKILEFYNELESALQCAKEATTPFKRQRLLKYRDDNTHGVLREELIFVVFLQEMVNSVNYTISRMDTDIELGLFEAELETYQKQHGQKGNQSHAGFVTNVLKSLTELKNADKNRIKQIFDSIDQRYQVGNKVFSLIREMQKFN